VDFYLNSYAEKLIMPLGL